MWCVLLRLLCHGYFLICLLNQCRYVVFNTAHRAVGANRPRVRGSTTGPLYDFILHAGRCEPLVPSSRFGSSFTKIVDSFGGRPIDWSAFEHELQSVPALVNSNEKASTESNAGAGASADAILPEDGVRVTVDNVLHKCNPKTRKILEQD